MIEVTKNVHCSGQRKGAEVNGCEANETGLKDRSWLGTNTGW